MVDAWRFEHLYREGRDALARGAAGLAADRLGAALALWHGPAFADVRDGGLVADEARRLDELRLVALEERIDAELSLGRHASLVAELERLVAEEPLRERLWRQLVLALYHSERQVEALTAYSRARTLLTESFGLDPSDELRALERAVLRQELTPASPAVERHNLPAPLTSFVGREHELDEIAEPPARSPSRHSDRGRWCRQDPPRPRSGHLSDRRVDGRRLARGLHCARRPAHNSERSRRCARRPRTAGRVRSRRSHRASPKRRAVDPARQLRAPGERVWRARAGSTPRLPIRSRFGNEPDPARTRRARSTMRSIPCRRRPPISLPTRWPGSRRSASLSSAAALNGAISLRQRTTSRPWHGSAVSSTACRSRSNWRPRGPRRSPSMTSPTASTTASASCARGARWPRHATRRFGRRSTGATSCSEPTSVSCWQRSPSSREGSLSTRSPRSARTATVSRPKSSSADSSNRRSSSPGRGTARRGTGSWRRSASTRRSDSTPPSRRDEVHRSHAEYFLEIAKQARADDLARQA